MNIDFKPLINKGFDVEMGIEYTGGDEGFLYILQRYYRAADKVSNSLSDFLIKKDMESFQRLAHSLKGNSKMIGADELASLAEQLETMAKNDNYSGLLLKTPEFLVRYNEVIEIIRPYGEMEEVHPAGGLTGEEAKQKGDEIIEALEELDDERAKELTEELMGYPFRARQRSLLRDAIDCIADFDYDAAAEIINAVIKEVED